MDVEAVLKAVRHPDWLLGRLVDVANIGYCEIVAVDSEKNEVTVQVSRNKRVKLTVDFVADYFLVHILTQHFEPKDVH